jgi:hypothetical protein
MWEFGCGCLPVLPEDGMEKISGVITEREFLHVHAFPEQAAACHSGIRDHGKKRTRYVIRVTTLDKPKRKLMTRSQRFVFRLIGNWPHSLAPQ